MEGRTLERAPADIAVLAPSATPRISIERLRAKMGRSSRYPLTLLTLVFAVNVAHTSLLPAVFPLLKVEFRLSDTALGVLGSSFLIFASLGMVPFAVAADRYSRTRIIAWALVLWGALILFISTAGSFARIFVGRMLLGITDPAEQPTSYSLLADYYQVEERGRVFAVWNIGQLSGLLLVPLGGALADAYGWRAALNFFAIPAFVLSIFIWRLQEPERGATDRMYEARKHGRGDELAQAREGAEAASVDGDGSGDGGETAETGAAPQESFRSAVAAYGQLLRIPTLLVCLVAIGMQSFFTRGLGVWLAIFFVRFYDMSLSQATGAVALLAFGALIGSLGGGYLGDYLTNIRGIRAGRMRLAGVSGIAAAVLLLIAFSQSNTAVMLVVFFVGAVLVFPPQPLLQAVVANVVHPSLRGRGASLDTLMQTAMGATSIFIYGVLSDAIGLRTTMLAVVPITAVGGLIVLTLGPRFLANDEDRVRGQLDEEMGLDTAAAPAR